MNEAEDQSLGERSEMLKEITTTDRDCADTLPSPAVAFN